MFHESMIYREATHRVAATKEKYIQVKNKEGTARRAATIVVLAQGLVEKVPTQRWVKFLNKP